MLIFKTRIWVVAYNVETNTNINVEEIDVLRKYKYHSIFSHMNKTDYDNFLQKIEYQIDRKTFKKLITNPQKFNSYTRWNSKKKNYQLTPFCIEDHLTYINFDAIDDEAHLLKSELNSDENGCYFIEATWYTIAQQFSTDDILMILDGIHDGSNGGENTFSFNKQSIYNILKKYFIKIFPTEICSIISNYTEDIYCFDISAMFPTTKTHSTIEREDKIITVMKTNNKIQTYEEIMNYEF